MSNPFSDIQNALAASTGIDVTLAGIILGSILTVAIVIMLTFILDPRAKGKGDASFILSAGLGIIISTAVGWFPIWIPLFAGLLITFVILNPLESRRTTG